MNPPTAELATDASRANVVPSADDVAKALHSVERLAALRELSLLDGGQELAFDRLTRLASRILRAPIALVSLVDEHRQFFVSSIGLAEPWASQRETPLSHSFCQYAVASGVPLVVDNAHAHAVLCTNQAVPDLGVVAYAGIPLITAEQHALGTVCVIDTQPRQWTEEELATLNDLAALVMTEIDLRGMLAKNTHLLHDAQRLSITDGLTGLYNRRGLFELGQRELERAHRLQMPLTAVLFDVDHFKMVNDTHGHQVGDEVLRSIAERGSSAIRDMDLIGRHGGEEFAILLSGSDRYLGATVAERVRQRISMTPVATSAGELAITVSAGVAEASATTAEIGSLLAQADRALYQAKRAGRDRVVIDEPAAAAEG